MGSIMIAILKKVPVQSISIDLMESQNSLFLTLFGIVVKKKRFATKNRRTDYYWRHRPPRPVRWRACPLSDSNLRYHHCRRIRGWCIDEPLSSPLMVTASSALVMTFRENEIEKMEGNPGNCKPFIIADISVDLTNCQIRPFSLKSLLHSRPFFRIASSDFSTSTFSFLLKLFFHCSA